MGVCLFWTIVLCMDWCRQGSVAKMRMMAFGLAATLLYVCHFVYFNHECGLLHITDTIYCVTNLAVYPLFYLYLKETTDAKWSKWWYMMLMPALIAGLTVGALYMVMTEEELTFFTHRQLYDTHYIGYSPLLWVQFMVHKTVKVVFAALVVTVLLCGHRRLKMFDKMVENCYADTEERNMRMMRGTVAAMLVMALVSFLVNIIGRSYFSHSVETLGVASIVFSSLLFTLLYAGHQQNFTIRELVAENEETTLTGSEPVETEAETETERVVMQLSTEIDRVMERDKLYLIHDLRINDLARRLGTNRDYIYQAITNIMGLSFAEYVNKKRVDYAIKLMKEKPGISTNEVCALSGFASQASYFRNFKLYTGTSPKDYLKKITTFAVAK